jgi:hypothetical protein
MVVGATGHVHGQAPIEASPVAQPASSPSASDLASGSARFESFALKPRVLAAGADIEINLRRHQLLTHVSESVLSLDDGFYCVVHVEEKLQPSSDNKRQVDTLRGEYRIVAPVSWRMLTFADHRSAVPLTDPTAASLVAMHPGKRQSDPAFYTRSLGLFSGRTPARPLQQAVEAFLGAPDGRAAATEALLRTLPQPLEQVDATEHEVTFWTAKTLARHIHHLLFTRSASGKCDIVIERRALLIGEKPEHRKTFFAKHSSEPQRKPLEAPDKVANANGIGKRTARIEYIGSDGTLAYCSGHFLTSTTVLTAGHCVLSDTTECGADPFGCRSYAVDIDYRYRRGGSIISMPVTDVLLNPVFSKDSPRNTRPVEASDRDFDYAVLFVEPHPWLAENWATVAIDTPSARPDEAISVELASLAIVAHPDGDPAILSVCNRGAVSAKRRYLAHNCFTEGGSSGALVWQDEGTHSLPLGLHFEALKECSNPDNGSNMNRVEGRGLKESVDDANLNNFNCLGGALTLGAIAESLKLLVTAKAEQADGALEALQKKAAAALDALYLLGFPSSYVQPAN